ncbi:MAG: tetratricopeptide repeat protein [Pirellulales bacterium]|nr:tetratricopeptide repeat protein [Pirellulales bacterium]
MRCLIALACGLCCLPTLAADEETRSAPLLDGLGKHSHPVTTQDPVAQRYFDQGLMLSYAFNHAEAERSFREVTQRDPQCAMAWWGVALVLGPNINAPMMPDAVPRAHEALHKGLALADHASPRERAYLDALSKRYGPEPVEDRAELNQAYADAMRRLVEQYPDDLDAATLLAEALMDLHPWDYWTDAGEPQPWTSEFVALIESVLRRDPNHPGANHLYIHAVEASPTPERALAAAQRLATLAPAAGHLVHMPSHIYIRVGRYQDATIANEKAIDADDEYIAQCHAQGLYPLAYAAHNHHFLSAAATMEGRSRQALEAAMHMSKRQDHKLMREEGMASLQHYWIWPLYVQVRFGKWDDILATEQPAADLKYPRGVWHYARAMALLRSGDLDGARVELTKLRELAADPDLANLKIWDANTTGALLQIAAKVVAGELAAAEQRYDEAIGELQAAVALEDALRYDEPATWHLPVRQNLGAVLIAAGRPAEAAEAFQQDLKRYPHNGWSLSGLADSLAAAGKPDEASQARKQFDKSWARADVALPSARF